MYIKNLAQDLAYSKYSNTLVSFKSFCFYVIVHGTGLPLVPVEGLFHSALGEMMEDA